MSTERKSSTDTVDDQYIYGRNVVLAFLEQAEKNEEDSTNYDCGQLEKVFLAQGLKGPDKRIEKIKVLARQWMIPVVICDRQQLDRLVGNEARHQGVVARFSQAKTLSLSEFLQSINSTNSDGDTERKNMLLAIIDGIQDPQNLGAIIRVAQAAGAKGLITPIRRSAGTTAAVAKASSGALARLPIVKVQNLVAAINEIKKHGFWIAGLDAQAKETLFNHDLHLPLAVVIGSEGKGLSRLVAEQCDFLWSIPMSDDSESLNAAVAAGVVFYEYVRQNCVKKNN